MKLQTHSGAQKKMKPSSQDSFVSFHSRYFSPVPPFITTFMVLILSCGPSATPTPAECKTFAQKLKKLPDPTTIPNVESSVWSAIGKDFLTVGKVGENFRFSRLTVGGQSTPLGTVASGNGMIHFIAGEATITARISGLLGPTRSKLVSINAAGPTVTELKDVPDPSFVSIFEGLVTRLSANADQVVTTSGVTETIEFSTATSPEVKTYRDVARNADSVCVVELLGDGAKARLHCKGPTGSYILSIDGLPVDAFGIGLPNKLRMTPTHVLWEQSQKIFAAELKEGATFQQIQIQGFDRLESFNAYCGASIFARAEGDVKAFRKLFFWSEGEITQLEIDSGRISASGVSYGKSVQDQNGKTTNSIVTHAF